MSQSTKSLFIALCLLGLKIICGEEVPTPCSGTYAILNSLCEAGFKLKDKCKNVCTQIKLNCTVLGESAVTL